MFRIHDGFLHVEELGVKRGNDFGGRLKRRNLPGTTRARQTTLIRDHRKL